MPVGFVKMSGKHRKKLGELLLENNVITEQQLIQGLEYQKKARVKLGEALIELNFITEKDVLDVITRQYGIKSINILELTIPDKVCNMVEESFLRKYCLVPFAIDAQDPTLLKVAMADPLDIIAIDDLVFLTGMRVEPYAALQTDINTAIARYYGNEEAKKAAERYTQEKLEEKKQEKKEEPEDAEIENSPIVQLTNKIIEQAVRQRASDIHIEPLEKQIRVRYRVDGVLETIMRYDIGMLGALVARIKIIGGMDISEKRKPQDGRITSVVGKQEYDIRVSVLPTVFGEKVVMRLTSKSGLTKAKKDLGFSEDELEKFDRILKNPHGIILVTGPTGSGKSTTLYTALSELNVDGVNIITVEDPVEANIDGINQVQVNTKADLTFASALRSILRQDPDIIMIGEIRDRETAEIAIKASITGHLVVSTLHTNSAASTITRLIDMGIEPYLIADATVGVIAQRLVRRLCPKCKKQRYMNNFEKKLMNIPESTEQMVYEPHGCNQCNNSGFYGRIGVYEIMPMTMELREVISSGANAQRIQEEALRGGLKTLKVAAEKYVLDGTTSTEELRRIIAEE